MSLQSRSLSPPLGCQGARACADWRLSAVSKISHLLFPLLILPILYVHMYFFFSYWQIFWDLTQLKNNLMAFPPLNGMVFKKKKKRHVEIACGGPHHINAKSVWQAPAVPVRMGNWKSSWEGLSISPLEFAKPNVIFWETCSEISPQQRFPVY